MLTRWPAFTNFLDDGGICLTKNSAERAQRGLALGRKASLFTGSDRAAATYTMIITGKLNDIDPDACLADVVARIASLPQNRLPDFLPWHWAMAKDHRKLMA